MPFSDSVIFIIILLLFFFFCSLFEQGPNDISHRGGTYAGIYLGDPDIGELTISEMSPEDIRAELKRYALNEFNKFSCYFHFDILIVGFLAIFYSLFSPFFLIFFFLLFSFCCS